MNETKKDAVKDVCFFSWKLTDKQQHSNKDWTIFLHLLHDTRIKEEEQTKNQPKST